MPRDDLRGDGVPVSRGGAVVNAPMFPPATQVDLVRNREGAALNAAERALRVILASAHEDVVIEHAERGLRRVREIMTA